MTPPPVWLNTLGCPEWSLETIAHHAKVFGYNGIELRANEDGNHFHPGASPEETERVGRLFRNAGVPVTSLMGYTKFAFTDRSEIAANQAVLRQLIQQARILGAPFIRSFAGQLPKGSDRAAMIRTVADALHPLAEEALASGIRIGLETHDDWCSGEVIKAVMDRANSRGLGVVYDILNAWDSGAEPWDVAYPLLKPHILYCHLKDGYRLADGKLRYVLLGAGDLPLRAILARFKADGFEGAFSFEWEKKWHAELEAPERAMPHFPHKVRATWASV
ncbi:MAG: sugar phosphate isomerase/epimerase family protein [Candidatus Coatesbacteria bacterium]